MVEATRSQRGPMSRYYRSRSSTLVKFTYIEIEPVGEIDIVRSIHRPIKLRVKSSRDT